MKAAVDLFAIQNCSFDLIVITKRLLNLGVGSKVRIYLQENTHPSFDGVSKLVFTRICRRLRQYCWPKELTGRERPLGPVVVLSAL